MPCRHGGLRMKKKGRHEQCKHALQAFDEIVLVDLGCKFFGLCHGTACVTKHMCQYCPCMEKKKNGESLERYRKPETPAS